MEVSARYSALKILNEYYPGKSNLSKIISKELSQSFVHEKGLVRDLVWETVRRLNTVDYFINKFATKPSEIEFRVRNVLRLGMVQILFLGVRIPEYAAVNETVNLARKIGRPGVGALINAVLRNTIRKKDDLPWPLPDENGLFALAIKTSHPEWMVKRWLERYGKDETERFCSANNSVSGLVARVNTLKISREELKSKLEEEGVKSEFSLYSPDGLVLLSNPELEKLKCYNSGLFLVQDEASQMVPVILDPKPGETILDLCCGAGVKSSHMAQIAEGKAKIIGVDSSADQVVRCEENFTRLGIENVEILKKDFLQMESPVCDRVLLDAPCSGLGSIRRKPDIKWNRKEDDIKTGFPSIQKEMISSASRLIRKGGTLVYSTCTNEPEETSDVVNGFLKDNPNFTLKKIELPEIASNLISNDGMFFNSLPHSHGTDGFFAARLEKNS